jgi:hypothetical protein
VLAGTANGMRISKVCGNLRDVAFFEGLTRVAVTGDGCIVHRIISLSLMALSYQRAVFSAIILKFIQGVRGIAFFEPELLAARVFASVVS